MGWEPSISQLTQKVVVQTYLWLLGRARLLAGIGDPDRLQDEGEWIVDCDAGNDLLARLEGAA